MRLESINIPLNGSHSSCTPYSANFCSNFIATSTATHTHAAEIQKKDALRCVLQMPFIILSVHDENIHIMLLFFRFISRVKNIGVCLVHSAHTYRSHFSHTNLSSSDRMHCFGFCIKIDTHTHNVMYRFEICRPLSPYNEKSASKLVDRPREQQITHRIGEISLSSTALAAAVAFLTPHTMLNFRKNTFFDTETRAKCRKICKASSMISVFDMWHSIVFGIRCAARIKNVRK